MEIGRVSRRIIIGSDDVPRMSGLLRERKGKKKEKKEQMEDKTKDGERNGDDDEKYSGVI